MYRAESINRFPCCIHAQSIENLIPLSVLLALFLAQHSRKIRIQSANYIECYFFQFSFCPGLNIIHVRIYIIPKIDLSSNDRTSMVLTVFANIEPIL